MSLEALFLENGISYLKCQSRIKWTENNGKIKIDIPLSIPHTRGQKLVDYAWVFKISQ